MPLPWFFVTAIVKSSSAGPPDRFGASAAKRARIVLLAADGVANTRIAELSDATVTTVLSWRSRYEDRGIARLSDAPRSGRPRELDHRQIVTEVPDRSWSAGSRPQPRREERAGDLVRHLAVPRVLHHHRPGLADTVAADKTHPGHAIIKQIHSDLKHSALAHLPSGKFTANATWLEAGRDGVHLTRGHRPGTARPQMTQ